MSMLKPPKEICHHDRRELQPLDLLQPHAINFIDGLWHFSNLSLAYDQVMQKAPVAMRSQELSNNESAQYLDGWPLGNSKYCNKLEAWVQSLVNSQKHLSFYYCIIL